MKKLVMFVAVCLLFSGIAYAQQDPDDPGIQDSIILGSAYIDSGAGYHYVNVDLFAVTDDSVFYFNIPIRWNAPYGGIEGTTPHTYFPPITNWDDVYDSILIGQHYFRQFGFADLDTEPNPPLFTNGQRTRIMTLKFYVESTARRQLVTLDTCWDDRSRSVMLGLIDGVTEITPAIQVGFIGIGVGVDGDVITPLSFALDQNYPNPFNPETNIDFQLPIETDVSLAVYNLLGQEVKSLVNGRLGAGKHTAHWDGKNANGANVPSGVYFYRLTTPDYTKTNKMIMLR
jgi:hypothetical protein